MIDYLGFIGSESERFNRAVAAIESSGSGSSALAAAPVPSCDGWSAADLTWHLAEVQYFWSSIVEGNLSSYSEVVPLQRPSDDQLVALQAEQGTRLVGLLAAHAPDEPCWSWHREGRSVGWVLRRQAHESLIHRVDAELTAEEAGAGSRSSIDEALAADGVDEMLTVMLDIGTLPEGARFEASDRTARLVAPQQSWDLTIGRVLGTGAADDAAISLGAVIEPSVEIRATASDLDLWLWRRSQLADGAATGDRAAVDELYELAAIE